MSQGSDSTSDCRGPVTPEQLRQFLARLDTLIDLKNLKNNTSFREAGADSFDFFTIVLAIQQEYGVTVPDEDISKVNTLEKLAEYLNAGLS